MKMNIGEQQLLWPVADIKTFLNETMNVVAILDAFATGVYVIQRVTNEC